MITRQRASPIERWAGWPVDVVTNCSPEFRLTGQLWLIGKNPAGAELAVDLYRMFWFVALSVMLFLFDDMPPLLQGVSVACAYFRVVEIISSGIRLYLLPRPGEGAPVLRFGRSVTVATMQVSGLVLAFAILYLADGGVMQGEVPLQTPVEAGYFSVVTITTLGYGDFMPVSTHSRILVIFQLISGILIVMGFMPLVNAQIALHARVGVSRQAKAADAGLLQPPQSLDGADVVQWAWSGNQPFFGLPSGMGELPIHGIAICRYIDSGKIYRFCCNANWEVVHDSSYPSVEEALAAASRQFDVHDIRWHEWKQV